MSDANDQPEIDPENTPENNAEDGASAEGASAGGDTSYQADSIKVLKGYHCLFCKTVVSSRDRTQIQQTHRLMVHGR